MPARVTLALAAAATCLACARIDPGPNFVVPDERYDQDFFFCHVEPEYLVARRCGPGDPAAGDRAGGCHFNASAVSGMALVDHAPVECEGGRPSARGRGQVGAGSAAQANLQAATLVMSRDVATAPIATRPAGASHPRAVIAAGDPALDVLREWAQR